MEKIDIWSSSTTFRSITPAPMLILVMLLVVVEKIGPSEQARPLSTIEQLIEVPAAEYDGKGKRTDINQSYRSYKVTYGLASPGPVRTITDVSTVGQCVRAREREAAAGGKCKSVVFAWYHGKCYVTSEPRNPTSEDEWPYFIVIDVAANNHNSDGTRRNSVADQRWVTPQSASELLHGKLAQVAGMDGMAEVKFGLYVSAGEENAADAPASSSGSSSGVSEIELVSMGDFGEELFRDPTYVDDIDDLPPSALWCIEACFKRHYDTCWGVNYNWITNRCYKVQKAALFRNTRKKNNEMIILDLSYGRTNLRYRPISSK